MARFKFRDEEYDAVDKPLFVELTYCEEKFHKGQDEWTITEQMMVGLYLAVRRRYPDSTSANGLTWDELQLLGPDDLEVLPDPPAEPEPEPTPDPTAAVTETAAQSSTAG